MNLEDTLSRAIGKLQYHYQHDGNGTRVYEEAGGFILKDKDPDYPNDYAFMEIDNLVAGQPAAAALYIADPYKVGEKIYNTNNRYKVYATIHTHPTFSNDYSQIDLNNIFTGYALNYIYSIRDKALALYKWGKNEDGEEVPIKHLVKMP